KLDQMIDRILGGSQLETESRRLASWLNEYPTATIVLGCTEFSLLNERTPLFDAGLDKRFTLCDPNLIIAKQITDKCYEQSIPRINS
ncbi:MAG: hypothetical protein KGJ02_06510, partial [Verrucomicrobiota bacterium]|nr:hypothetical protein [Verrucomicrobiota bacterium]